MANRNTLNADVTKQQNLANAVALVTGSSRGIGKSIALKLASLGAAVGICGRDAEALANTRRELEALGATVHSQTTDVTKAGEVAALVDATEKNLGPISV